MTEMRVCDEMKRLRKYLDEKGISWSDKSEVYYSKFWICRTHFELNGYKWSVIHGYGTFGGIMMWNNKDNGLLELMTECIDGGEPRGSLTADEVIELMEKCI